MSNTDNITKNMGVGPVGALASGEGTLDVNTGTFGVVSKSNAMTDGVSVATASRNMAEVYNRILLDMASCLDLAVKVGDPVNPGAFGNLLPAGAVDARDIGKNWTPIATMAYVLKQGIDGLKGAVSSLSSQVAGLEQGAALYTFTGSVQYEKLTNTITAAGIGDGTEPGDVIRVTGSTANNKLFTVESRVNANAVIVNAAHANGAGPLSLNDETLTSTVKCITKWYNAPIGLGQAWVNVTASRSKGTLYNVPTNRTIKIWLSADVGHFARWFEVDGFQFLIDVTDVQLENTTLQTNTGGTYRLDPNVYWIRQWAELR